MALCRRRSGWLRRSLTCAIGATLLYFVYRFNVAFKLQNPSLNDHRLSPDNENSDDDLIRIFVSRLSSLPCVNSTCHAKFSPSPEVRMRQILATRTNAYDLYRSAVTSINEKVSFHKYILVSAVSDNHYNEMQALVKSLINDLFPRLDNYTFVLFDLGLTAEQRQKTERNCKCTVVDFPFHKLPSFFKGLKCYTWKPFIIRSLIEKSEFLIWTDTSIRWNPAAPLAPLFKRAREQGLQVWGNSAAMSLRTAVSMFDFYGEKTCQYSRFTEVESGLTFYHNQRFVREAVLDSWVSCALDERCMCVKDYKKLLVCYYSPPRRDNGCHRFDQSSLGIIITKLYGEQRGMVWFPYRPHSVFRGQEADWFNGGVVPS
ncbi:hypothetical protein BaRGS_00022491 [Batillaria attramentaria]|uniref:Uncharacterized protein n=1 Tax=Batillaria attramentaria TaxID=370345 RepID=A0ABD0KHA9_9CAEN